ncbi:hypothetical protein TRVA0_047S00122 [Trichomonascus vanleenenianus]|uniref:uncharacterized protein n=1 Tax=Trichomonascus vanleenenianus TaxID=2268995 RepID=UPI003ECA30FB
MENDRGQGWQGDGYSIIRRQQSPALLEYIVTKRPLRPSWRRIAAERLVYLVKAVFILASVVFLIGTNEYPLYYRLTAVAFSIIVASLRLYKEESVLALQQFGIQITSSGPFYFTNKKKFIPRSQLGDILIQESFIGVEIRFLIVIVVIGEDRLEVVFRSILPRREDLEIIWRDIRRCYFHDK